MNRQVVNAVVSSLNDNPLEWTFGKYNAVHQRTGTTIWIGNSIWGLDINGHGGVVVFGWFTPWRVKVWKAINNAIGQQFSLRFKGDAA